MPSALLNVMIKAAKKASIKIRRDFNELENLQVSLKGPGDFVTSADIRTQKIIIEELIKAKPDWNFLAEEKSDQTSQQSKNRFIIDPIDGTTNFLHGIPHFCISLALLSYSEIVSGLIFDPIKNEIFYAEKNNGAYFNNQRIRVSKKKNLSECLFATNKNGAQYKDINVRISGSAALDLAYVSSGRLDGYYQKDVNLWDIAAGLLLVKEAGGKTNFIDFQKTSNHKLLASSNNIHDKMIEKLDKF